MSFCVIVRRKDEAHGLSFVYDEGVPRVMLTQLSNVTYPYFVDDFTTALALMVWAVSQAQQEPDKVKQRGEEALIEEVEIAIYAASEGEDPMARPTKQLEVRRSRNWNDRDLTLACRFNLQDLLSRNPTSL